MEYRIENWTIIQLITLYKEDRLILDPPYQRNFIWSKADQKELINSIVVDKFPLPSFFLFQKDGGKYEMVDGQQRTRTILEYYRTTFENSQTTLLSTDKEQFEKSELSITIIEKLTDSETIEEFYARVNKSGRKVNKPELNKAEFFYTKFLALNEALADNPSFTSLDLFGDSSINRMNDVDFISELVTYLKFGITDKKDKVDVIYESDLGEDDVAELNQKAIAVFDKIAVFNRIYPIKKTRFKQRNDFYTLFNFIDKHNNIDQKSLDFFYKLLVSIAPQISPSNELCLPFKEYAINCVSQSNSKKAREARLKFLEDLLLNNSESKSLTLVQVLEFYGIQEDPDSTILVDQYLTINYQKIIDLTGEIGI